jgi:hypothetical protein
MKIKELAGSAFQTLVRHRRSLENSTHIKNTADDTTSSSAQLKADSPPASGAPDLRPKISFFAFRLDRASSFAA